MNTLDREEETVLDRVLPLDDAPLEHACLADEVPRLAYTGAMEP